MGGGGNQEGLQGRGDLCTGSPRMSHRLAKVKEWEYMMNEQMNELVKD